MHLIRFRDYFVREFDLGKYVCLFQYVFAFILNSDCLLHYFGYIFRPVAVCFLLFLTLCVATFSLCVKCPELGSLLFAWFHGMNSRALLSALPIF